MVKVRIMSAAHGDMVQDYEMNVAAEVIMQEKEEGRATFIKSDSGKTHEIDTIEQVTEWLEEEGQDAQISVIPNIAGG